MDAVTTDQQRAALLRGRAVGMFDARADAAVGILGVAGHAAPEPHRLRSEPLLQLLVEQHVELPAVHRVLRPVVAGEQPARLRIDVVAVQPDQRPFLRRNANPVEVLRREAEVVELAHCIRLQVDADTERAHVAHRLEHDAGDPDLVQRQRRREPAEAAARDQYRIVSHAGPARPIP
jgi:hypothetical protein